MALTKNQKWMIAGGIVIVGLYVANKQGWFKKKAEPTTTDTGSGINGAQYVWEKEKGETASVAGGCRFTCSGKTVYAPCNSKTPCADAQKQHII